MRSNKTERVQIYGYHPVLSALQNPERTPIILRLMKDATLEIFEKVLPQLHQRVNIQLCTRTQFHSFVTKDAVHQGILLETTPLPSLTLDNILKISHKCQDNYLRREEGRHGRKKEEAQGPYMMLDHITDPHNSGAIFRTCHALGAKGVIMTKRHSPDLTSPVVSKAAAGALDQIPICHVSNLTQAITTLHTQNIDTVGLTEKAPQLATYDLTPKKTCLIIGAEGKGLRRLTKERSRHLAALPTNKDFSTLNVAVAAALALHIIQHKEP